MKPAFVEELVIWRLTPEHFRHVGKALRLLTAVADRESSNRTHLSTVHEYYRTLATARSQLEAKFDKIANGTWPPAFAGLDAVTRNDFKDAVMIFRQLSKLAGWIDDPDNLLTGGFPLERFLNYRRPPYTGPEHEE